jgi:TolA-binding protein
MWLAYFALLILSNSSVSANSKPPTASPQKAPVMHESSVKSDFSSSGPKTPQEASWLKEQYKTLVTAEKFEQAIPYLKRFVDRFPTDVEQNAALFLLGKAEFATQHYTHGRSNRSNHLLPAIGLHKKQTKLEFYFQTPGSN